MQAAGDKQTKNRNSPEFLQQMIKKISSPKIKIWFEPMFLQVLWQFFGSWRSRTADNFKFFFGGIQSKNSRSEYLKNKEFL